MEMFNFNVLLSCHVSRGHHGNMHVSLMGKWVVLLTWYSAFLKQDPVLKWPITLHMYV